MSLQLWIHYPSHLYPDLDKKIISIVEEAGGNWFGAGMAIADERFGKSGCRDGRDNSFNVDEDSLDQSLSMLSLEFSVQFMRLNKRSSKDKSYHFMVFPDESKHGLCEVSR